MHSDDCQKTVFIVPDGFYECKIIPFGLANASAAFMHMMPKIFHPHCRNAIVYLDDVLIFSRTLAEHKTHVEGVLQAFIRKKNLCPDAPGAQDALDAPWQGTDGSQHKTHRQYEFGRSTPWHREFRCRMPAHRASGLSSPWHLLTRQSVSGHFPSGRSHVRACSFWTQPCQGIWRPDDVCHGTTVTLSVKARNIVANTLVALANT